MKWGCAILVCLILAIGIAFRISDNKPRRPVPAQQAAPVATIDKSPEKQAARDELIQKLIREGVFQKVEPGSSIPSVWVTPAFYLLDFETKQKFISVVYAYYFDGSDKLASVRLKDSKTGKEVGMYSIAYGGLRME